MYKVKDRKAIICSKEEMKMMVDVDVTCLRWNSVCYNLPLFSLFDKEIAYDDFTNMSDYILIKPRREITEKYLKVVNETWNEIYENKH